MFGFFGGSSSAPNNNAKAWIIWSLLVFLGSLVFVYMFFIYIFVWIKKYKGFKNKIFENIKIDRYILFFIIKNNTQQ